MTNDPIRARLDDLANVQPGQLINPKSATVRELAAALRAVLDLHSLTRFPQGNPRHGEPEFCARHGVDCPTRSAIAAALGVE